MKLFKLLPALLLLAIVGAFSPAQAQISQGVRVCNPDQATWCLKPLANGSSPSGLVANFVATSQAKLSVTTVTSRLALPTTDPTVVLNNTGSVPVYFRFGNTTVNAGLGDIYLGAGSTVTLSPGPYGFVAAITASGSATVQVTMGQGVPYFVGGGGSGGGGGGGAVTIADGADVTEGGTIDAAATAGGIGTVSSKLRLLTSQVDTSNASLGTLAGTVSGGNINVACITGCSGGGGSGYSVLNTGAYANSTSYSNVPSGGLVATSAPTYTTGQASPISLTTGGNLRVADSAVASVLGSPFQAGGSIGNTSFAATQSGTWNITNVSGTISLPTGASTSALQTTGNTSLASIAAAASGSNLNVICTSGCSGGGGSGYSVLNASTYANSSSFSNVPAGGLVSTASPTYTTGQASPLNLTTAGALRTDGSGVTQPVSAASLPLPTGASTSAKQPAIGTAGTPSADVLTVQGSASGTALPVSAASLPLPTGAATSANQSTMITSLGTIATNSGTQATAANQSSQITQETAINTILGTVTASPTANTISDRLKTINTTLGSPFQAGASIGNTSFGVSGSLPAGSNIIGNVRIDQTTAGTTNGVVVNSSALPTGGATSALQTTGNGSLSTLAGTVSAGNVNVVCTSGCTGGGGGGYSVLNTSTYTNSTSFSNVPSGGLVATSAPTYTTGQASPVSLTTGGALRVDGSAATQPVSGTVACSNCSGTSYSVLNASTYANSSSFSNVPSGGLVSTSAPTYTTGQASPLSVTTAGALRTDASATTQPVSAASLPLPTGAATSAAQTTGNGSLATIATNTTNAGAPSIASDSTGNVKLFQANASAALTISTATTTQLVALTSSKKIYVTAYNFIASGTTTVTFVTGTGTNCATGQSSLTGAMDFTAQNGMAFGAGVGPVMVVPAGQALCVTNSAAFKVAGIVSYTVAP